MQTPKEAVVKKQKQYLLRQGKHFQTPCLGLSGVNINGDMISYQLFCIYHSKDIWQAWQLCNTSTDVSD